MTPALAAEIKGQLLLGSYKPAPAAKAPRPAFNWELENGVKEVARERIAAARELAVVLVGEGASKFPERIEIPFSGGEIMPSTLVVRVGTTVRIRNDDEIGHELYAENLDGFSSEATSPKAIRSVHLTKAGSFALRDKLTPHARAHLHVLPDLIALAKVEASGQFVFPDVRAGTYKLLVFHKAKIIADKDITVSDKPLTVDPLTLAEPEASP